MAGFAESVQIFVDRAKANADEVVRATGLKILARLIQRSPVGNPELWAAYQNGEKPPKGYTGGRFRGNWQISFDSSPDGETGRVDKSGSETLTTGGAMLAQFKAANNTVIYFTNNVPYAVRLEFGYSSQAPRGMVRITAQEFQKLFNEAARGLNT